MARATFRFLALSLTLFATQALAQERGFRVR